jgi:hypothetical protein
MFRVTVDLFSGRPNPTWIVDNENTGRELLEAIAKDKQIVAKPESGFQGLGYRGITFELFGDEDATDFDLPATFSITNGTGEDPRRGVEIAVQVIEGMTQFNKIVLPEHTITPINEEIRKLLLQRLRQYEQKPPRIFPIPKTSSKGVRITVDDGECKDDCKYEESRFNPRFWNSDPYVLRNNNCYNYARNWRTNTFAQPGKASGCYPYPMDCSDVMSAAICDGLRKRCDCLSEEEYPRRLMALVVDPGNDYHWYRKQKEGFWGHKPGKTPAKNVDNSGNVITDPRSCDRGGYTDFCGFFYAGKSVKII